MAAIDIKPPVDRYKAIADAIRKKNGTTELMHPADMPQAILDIVGGGGANYESIVYNEDNTITLTDKDGVEHTMSCTYADGKLIDVIYDGKAVNLTYSGDRLVKVGKTAVDLSGYTCSASDLIADIGNVEFTYIEEGSCFAGTFTLPENSIEPGKLYIINIDGTEYKSGSLGAQGEFYISNDAREDSMIMISKQEDVWTVAIYSANDFSGVHNIKIYKNSGEKKPYQILVGSRTDTGTGGSGIVYFYTDDFDAGSYNLEIKDEESTFNLDSHRYLDNIAFGFKSCDKAYSDASLKQVYLAIADGKKVSLIVTGRKDGIETTKTYILGTPDFEFTNQYTPRHYYCYGENYIPFMDCPS